jgi:hypothetical protein
MVDFSKEIRSELDNDVTGSMNELASHGYELYDYFCDGDWLIVIMCHDYELPDDKKKSCKKKSKKKLS